MIGILGLACVLAAYACGVIVERGQWHEARAAECRRRGAQYLIVELESLCVAKLTVLDVGAQP